MQRKISDPLDVQERPYSWFRYSTIQKNQGDTVIVLAEAVEPVVDPIFKSLNSIRASSLRIETLIVITAYQVESMDSLSFIQLEEFKNIDLPWKVIDKRDRGVFKEREKGLENLFTHLVTDGNREKIRFSWVISGYDVHHLIQLKPGDRH